MVGILTRIDGSSLPSWTILISPNAVIAILSSGAKAGMMIPVAECISQLKWILLGRSSSA